MQHYLRRLWREDDGYILAMEWMLVASILTLGAIAGMLALHHFEADEPIDCPALTR
jgi:hypothetical protein